MFASRRISTFFALLLLVAAVGCGGSSGPSAPGPAKGSYVRVTGALERTFSIEPDAVNVLCTPRPGQGIFELTAGTPLAGEGFALTYYEYKGTEDTDAHLEYSPSSRQHLIRVTFPGPDKGYSFTWNQRLRSDTSEVIPSICDLTIKREEIPTGERFTGTLVCSMLWAETNTDGFDPNAVLNNFVDLFAKFECDRTL